MTTDLFLQHYAHKLNRKQEVKLNMQESLYHWHDTFAHQCGVQCSNIFSHRWLQSFNHIRVEFHFFLNYWCCSCTVVHYLRGFRYLMSSLCRSSQQFNAILYLWSNSHGNLFASKKITNCCSWTLQAANTISITLTKLGSHNIHRTSGVWNDWNHFHNRCISVLSANHCCSSVPDSMHIISLAHTLVSPCWPWSVCILACTSLLPFHNP